MTKQSLADWYDQKYGKKPSAPAVEPTPALPPVPPPEPEPTLAAELISEPEPVAQTDTYSQPEPQPELFQELEAAPELELALESEPASQPEPAPVLESAPSPTLYEQLGGEAAVDDRISHFFENVNMETQAAKQKAFLTMAFGGPHHYTGLDMRLGHARLVEQGLNDSHFDAVVEDLAATLSDLGVPEGLISQVAAIAESTRNDVLGK
jgi:hemoglobin